MHKIPATCQKIRDQIKALRGEIQHIQSAPGYKQGPDDPRPGKPDPEALAEVKKLWAKVNALNSTFNHCLVKNVTPFPIRIAVSSIYCIEEQEGGLFQDDEPYVLVAGIEPASRLVELTLYGPSEDVNTGESRSFTGPPFWALDNQSAQVISDPNNVIFLVAFMENDDGTPTAARTLVKSELVASLAASVGMNRNQRVQTLINDMNDALTTPTGFPDSDDQIGSAQELRLSPLDLVRPILGPHVLTLTFSGAGAKYQVNCALTEG
jgi:hypothetical protein